MSLEPGSQRASATAGWTHGGDKHDILNFHERFFFLGSVVPTLVVHPLSQDLNWRLCTISFFLWHVQVVDEDCKSLSCRWPIDSFSSFLKLLIESFLSLICGGLSGESHRNILVILRHLILKHHSNVDCFASSGWSRAEYMLLFFEKKRGHVLHSDGIEGRHDDFRVSELAINLIRRHCVRPDNPFLLGLVPHVIIDQAFGWEIDFIGHHRSELLTELLSSFERAGAAD